MIDTSSLDKVGEYIEQLEEGGKQARKRVIELVDEKNKLAEENKKLKEFKTKREESMFYFKARMERAEPKTAREAEDLQRAKEIFEKLYREELSCLEEENKTLKDNVEFLHQCLDDRDKSIQYAEEENKKLNIKVASLEGEIKGLNSVIDKLKEENQTLELWLDNKEKVNKSLREERDKYYAEWHLRHS